MLDELGEALSARDMHSARRLAFTLVESGEHDDVLALLARHTQEVPRAAELFIEVLDATGVVHRFAGAALLDQAAVDDVAQDSLISIAGSIGSYNGRSKVTTWVHSIVKRRVVDHLRRQRETAPLDEHVGEAVRMSSMIAARASVRAALDGIDELYRTPVVLRDVEGLPYVEIAQRLDRAEGTIKAQISRGRAMVAATLRGQDGTY